MLKGTEEGTKKKKEEEEDSGRAYRPGGAKTCKFDRTAFSLRPGTPAVACRVAGSLVAEPVFLA